MSDTKGDFSIGSVWVWDYPRHNYLGVARRWEVRHGRVVRVRDLEREPLDDVTAKIDPNLDRGGRLIYMFDFDRGAERCFYEGSMRNVQPWRSVIEEPHEIAILDPDSDPETVYRAPNGFAAVAWLRWFIQEPLGFTVALIPPRRKAI